MLTLPEPSFRGTVSVEEALRRRRSTRAFLPAPLAVDQVGQLLWSAYGVTHQRGWRTTPSARECYPLEIALVASQVDGLDSGLFYYNGVHHSLSKGLGGDLRQALFETTFNQASVKEAPAVLVISAVYTRAEPEFGDSARDFVHMEVGHSGQNVHLQAEALGCGTVVIAAFSPREAARVLGLPDGQNPVYLMPVGRR